MREVLEDYWTEPRGASAEGKDITDQEIAQMQARNTKLCERIRSIVTRITEIDAESKA